MSASVNSNNYNKNDHANSKIIQFAFELLGAKELDDFKIWNNDLKFGIFNNVIVETTSNINKDIYALQLKYLADGENILKRLEEDGGDFSILKYFENYLQCQNSYSLDNVKYILYCNGGKAQHNQEATEISILYKREAIPLVIEEVNDGLPFARPKTDVDAVFRLRPKSDQFKLNSDKKEGNDTLEELAHLRQFLQNFYVYVSHTNFQEDECENREAFNSFYNARPTNDNFQAFTESIRSQIRIKLDKKHFGLKLLDCLINQTSDHTFKKSSAPQTVNQWEINEILIHTFTLFDVTITKNYESIVKLRNELLQHIVKEEELELKAAAYGLLPSDEGNLQSLTPNQLCKLLWYENRFPVIIKWAENKNLSFEKTAELCRTIQTKAIFIVGNNLQTLRETDVRSFENLLDLLFRDNRLYSRLTTKCSIRTTHDRIVSLNYFLQDDEELSALISVDKLLDLVSTSQSSDQEKDFTISPKHSHYFSPSLTWSEKKFEAIRLIRPIIDVQFLSQVQEKFVAIIVCREQLEHFQRVFDGLKLASDPEIYLYREMFTEADFEAFVQRQQPEDVPHHLFYLVKVNGNYFMEWIKTKGSVTALQNYRLNNHHSEPKGLFNSPNKLKIVCVNEDVHLPTVLQGIKAVLDPKCVILEMNSSRCQEITNIEGNLFEQLKPQYAEPWLVEFWTMLLIKERVIILWKDVDVLPSKLLGIVIAKIKENLNSGLEQWILSTEKMQTFLEGRCNTLAWELVHSTSQDKEDLSDYNLIIPHNGLGGLDHQWESIKKGYVEIAKKLVTWSTNSNECMPRSDENFVHFVAKGLVEEFEEWRNNNAKLFMENIQLLLFTAVQNGQLEFIELFVMNNVDINSVNEDGSTPLTLAAAAGDFEIVKFLTIYKADLNKTDRDGRTPIWLAAFNGHLSVVKYLNEKGANTRKKNKAGQSPVDAARLKPYTTVVQYLALYSN